MTKWNGPSAEFKIYSIGDRTMNQHILLRECEDAASELLPKGKKKYSITLVEGDRPYFHLDVESFNQLEWFQELAENLLKVYPPPASKQKVNDVPWA